MLALVAGFFLVGYLLAPGAIYRSAFSFFIPSKQFQRTRTEEVIFSVLAVFLPFFFACLLLFHTCLGRYPALHSTLTKGQAYKQVLQNLLSSEPPAPGVLPKNQTGNTTKPPMDVTPIYDAYWRILREQGRFLAWLWIFCFVEGLVNGLIVNHYGSYGEKNPLKWLCDYFLLKHVSEWQILFTTITLRSQDRKKAVEVDVICDGTLYRGRLVNWFTGQDGALAGIFITEAARFRRDDWNRDSLDDRQCKREDYWRPIPGAKLYLVADSISNYNVRYVDTLESSSDLISNILGSDVTIKPADTTDSSQS